MKAFYDSIRSSLFAGSLSQGVVDSIDMIQAKCRECGVTEPAQIAYILATVYHEVGPGMQPKNENLNYSAQALAGNWPHRYAENAKAQAKVPNALAKKLHRNPEAIANNCYANRMGNGSEASGDGWKFRGRDFCQTTGKDNYERAGRFAKVDLVKHPERIAELDIAANTLVYGMRDGWFTGRKLSHYITAKEANLKGARAIINGTDKADTVAFYATKFLTGLLAVSTPTKKAA